MSSEQITLTKEDFGIMAICATRYCHGRQTYMPSLVQDILKAHIKEISDKDLGVLIEDCRDQERLNLYGDERIDKPDWIAWKELLLKEKETRLNNVLKG